MARLGRRPGRRLGRCSRRPHGVSLVEALVALAVLTLGMLAYVGVQSALRYNADVAQQRSQAVRIAQEAIESWRGYVAVEADGAAATVNYAEIATLPDETVTPDGANTVYTRNRTVTDAAGADPAAPRIKTLVVDVGWDDRNGIRQSVRLSTTIMATPPELAGTLSVPSAGRLRPPLARHPAIPIEAVDEGARSRFTPLPAESPLAWVFDDATGVIVEICNTPDACFTTRALLLSGHVRFATGPVQPTGADAESPPSPALPVGVVVDRSFPSPLTVSCLQRLHPDAVAYFCAVPVTGVASGTPRWAGRSRVTGLDLAADLGDSRPDRLRVCRYTPYRDHRPVGSGTPPMRNADHPLDYGGKQPDEPENGVSTALTNQNFLVIRAGDGARAFDCPADVPTTPHVDGTTWHHQPSGT
jgi:Tfp pilus assembly protein PilV